MTVKYLAQFIMIIPPVITIQTETWDYLWYYENGQNEDEKAEISER